MNDYEERLKQHTETNRIAPDSRGKYADDVIQGVTQAWLAQAFRMAPNTVRARLVGCPVLSRRSRGDKMATTLYDLSTAASYLVQPKRTSKEYYKALKAGDLPAALSQSMWDALLKRQTYEERAGKLWSTEKVRSVLGTTFQTLKFTMQLWPETVERSLEFTQEQRDMLQVLIDGLQADIYDALVKNAETSSTGPMVSDMAELIGEEETVAEFDAALIEDEIAELI